MKNILISILVFFFLISGISLADDLTVVTCNVKIDPYTVSLDALQEINSTYNYTSNTDAETRFKDARYLLQKDEMYVAYNKDKEIFEAGYFACY